MDKLIFKAVADLIKKGRLTATTCNCRTTKSVLLVTLGG